MRKTLLFAAAWCMGIGYADAAVRDASAVTRTDTSQTVVSRAATGQTSATQSRTAAPKATTARTTSNSVSRVATPRTTAVSSNVTARSAAAMQSRAASNPTTARAGTKSSIVRSTVTPARAATSNSARSARAARATVSTSASQTNAFDAGYNICRDAYFTCMDQFCATQNESYRRCVCSSRLTDIQARERALSQAASQIQDFKDLNIEAIPKTAAEVKAMLTATEGETITATTKDTSASSQQLAGISAVLSGTKNKSLSTLGTLDIAGDINAIWATTDLASGATIANLTGESLYNAVHTQCVELVATQCPSQSTLNMVVSAYGMYIENDCTTLANALNKQKTAAQGTIRETEREMNNARLDNYNAHNSTSINDCIAQVRADITADTACGKDYVHCLDISGQYLYRETGEPIYSANFYQLETQVSLSGDVLTNQTNHMLVAELNRKREFAKRGLETCRDLADEVWDEFMRQAITEIYQGQQSRIRQVKEECLDVVNTCYDEQSQSLKDFSNVKDQMLLGSRLELSEQMCVDKLDACSNLYGGGPHGLAELLTAMHGITDQKIAKQCLVTLQDFAKDMCAPPSKDSLHSYPFACRVYAPGEQRYASNRNCNQWLWNSDNTSSSGATTRPIIPPQPTSGYVCPTFKKYTSCKNGYYLATETNGIWKYDPELVAGNMCLKCPAGSNCPGGTAGPNGADPSECGDDYIGSLYQKMVRYAMQACVRPSESGLEYDVPPTVLQDVNVVMSQIHVDMAKSLSAECERLGGIWVDTPWNTADNKDTMATIKGHVLYERFYTETGANTKWGYCATTESAGNQDTTTDTLVKYGCMASTGTWDDASQSCTCPSNKPWVSSVSMCRYQTQELACSNSGGTWASSKCTCTNGKQVDTDSWECR